MRPGTAAARAGLLAVLTGLFLVFPFRLSAPDAQTQPVDVAIVLAVDCSWSVDDLEYKQQMEGLAAAIRSRDVVDAIRNGPRGRIAVALLQWAAKNDQHLSLDWQFIETPEDAVIVSAKIGAAPRIITEGATSITAAISVGIAMHAQRPFAADRQVIDISGDGLNNTGGIPDRARDRAVDSGITVNGLAILNDVDSCISTFATTLSAATTRSLRPPTTIPTITGPSSGSSFAKSACRFPRTTLPIEN